MASLDISDALIGRTIAGKYIIESFLGGGAMGSVYRARQFALDKVVAIKVMRGELASDRSFVGRFRREAKAASKLAHAHSINVTDFGEETDGLLYIVMEFVAGRDLEQIMTEDGLPLADLRIADILAQVLSAVAVAHDVGIVHRDLKPANFLIVGGIDDEGNAIEHVKVCDFGIASMRGAEPDIVVQAVQPPGIPRPGPPRRASGNNKLTAVGALLGTPEYMSPEQAAGGTPGPASDIYSVGAILYELLTGQTVFIAPTPEELVLKQITETPLEPHVVRPSAHDRLASICMRALAKKPEDRYPNARAMRSELRAVLRLMLGTPSHSAFSVAAPSTQPGHTSSPVHLSSLPTPSHAISGLVILPATRPTADTIASQQTLEEESSRIGGALTDRAPKQTLRETGSLAVHRPKNRKKVVIGALAVVAAMAVAAGFVLTRHPAPAPVAQAPISDTTPKNSSSVMATSIATAPERAGSTTASAADVVVAPTSAAGVAAAAASARHPLGHVPSAHAADVGSAPSTAPAPLAAMTMAPTADPTPAPPTAAPAPPPDPVVTAAPAPPPPPPTVMPAAPPFSPDGARVMSSVTATNRASRASMASVISHTSFDDCYRNALRSVGHAEGGAGTAHLELDEDGIISNVQVHLPAPLSAATGCFAGKLRGQHVSNPDTGAATADIAFSLVPN